LVFSLLLILWISVTLGFIFPKTSSASFIYPGGQYGFVLSNWLSSLVGKAGVVILLFISILSILVIRFEKAFVLFKNLFRKKEKTDAETTTVYGDQADQSGF
jgi:DNA segregation ATPase FtsK/SpoIIIE, S-DNA-T family